MQIIPENNSHFSLNEHEKNKAIFSWSLQACHKKVFALAFKYNSSAQYVWGFFYFSLPLFVLWRNQGSNMLMLYCASKNKKSIQADMEQGKDVDISVFLLYGKHL